MPGALDSCINNVFEVGAIPASAGTPPVRVLLKDVIAVTVSEAAAALDATGIVVGFFATVSETAAAVDTTDAEGVPALVPRSAMLPGVFVNSDGTLREAYVGGEMVNL